MKRGSIVQILATSAIAAGVAIAIVGSPTIAGAPTTLGKHHPVESPASGRWYSPSSSWNTRIGPHPRIASNNASLIAAWSDSSACGSGEDCLEPAFDYTPAIWMAGRGTRSVPVRIDYPRCGARTVWMPIPRRVVPDPSPEGHLVITDANGTEYDLYEAQSPGARPSDRGCATADEWTAAKVVRTDWRRGSGELRGSVRGSGTPEGAGTILPRDTQQPAGSTWSHALAISYRSTCSHAMSWCPYVAPATDEDGTCVDQSRCVPEGARFQLNPSIDCSTWPALQNEWQRQLCRTLEVYGAIIVDTNSGGPRIYDQWRGSLGSYTWPWLQPDSVGLPGLPNDLLSHFRVLAWR